MSFGALSGVPNIAIAIAAEENGLIAGTGEGGLLEEIANNSRITIQWASARFGVDSSTLSKGQAIVIKMGQGAKPGIGGHLPSVKVTRPISETRRIPMGRDAISPAPHHDIYSIEDLGQRIIALKSAFKKPIFVKVGATNYIPYIASGIARMGASGIIIDGAGAGTGAAPSVVKDNVGIPIELAVSSVDQVLRKEGLRDGFTVIAAGRVSTPEDSLKLVALGADITSLGTAALISLGCIMVHKCHLGFCPAVLTNKISSNQAKVLSIEQSVLWLTNFIRGWNEEMRILLQHMGLKDIQDLRGRRDLLDYTTMNPETVDILALQHSKTSQPDLKVEIGPLWTPRRIALLRAMAGTTGKSPGEAEISSMGTTAAPVVEDPVRISDYLVSDGAQVTRPSIDPYREEIETSFFVPGTNTRLSSPFFFTHIPRSEKSLHLDRIFAKVASSMGLVFDMRSSESSYYSSRIVFDYSKDPSKKIMALSLASFELNVEDAKILRNQGTILFLTSPCSQEQITNCLAVLEHNEQLFSGVILDEDEGGMPLEIAVSLLDKELKQRNQRYNTSIFAESNSIRGSDDIFKILALGADAVGLGKAALLAIGFEDGRIIFDYEKSVERLENFVIALQKDIKLLAGAAGVSSLFSSLVGNHELLRSVDLDPKIRRKLGVKPAGAL